jgi:hypothetical protein
MHEWIWGKTNSIFEISVKKYIGSDMFCRKIIFMEKWPWGGLRSKFKNNNTEGEYRSLFHEKNVFSENVLSDVVFYTESEYVTYSASKLTFDDENC